MVMKAIYRYLFLRFHNPTREFELYCKQNPWARECRVYEI